MLSTLLGFAVLALLDVCLASKNPTLRAVRPPSARNLIERAGVQSIEAGVNLTTIVQRSAIIPIAPSVDGQSYYGVISVGNISFRVALDTASSDLWLVSSQCGSSQCWDIPKYELGYQSPTFVSVNSNQTAFNVSYADGTVAGGFVAQESVQISNLSVPDQKLGIVTSSNLTFTDDISGILGFGFPRLSSISRNVVNATPFFATLAQRGQLDYPLFGLNLPKNTTGSLTLGAVDGSVVTNTSLIGWNEVVPFAPFGSESNTSSYLQWAVPLSSISIGSASLIPQPTYPNITTGLSLALLDVGTPGIYGPYGDVSRIYSSIAGSRLVDQASGQWIIPCDSNQTISFQFGTQNYTMQPTDYLIGPAQGNPALCLSWPRAALPSSDGIDWQFGTAFLRTVYSVFSFGINTKEPPMVGFYALRNSTAPVQSPDVVSSYFSLASATVSTTLPNFLIPTPSPSIPSYTFNASVSAPAGKIMSTGLATSTYSPALGTHHISAIPMVSPSPTLATFIITSNGQLVTSVSAAPTISLALGRPPGWTSAASHSQIPFIITIFSGLVTFVLIFARMFW